MKNIFTKKNVRTLTLGEKLRCLRDEKRITLSEVSRMTKIQLKYLECLESGQCDKLPADVYVKGFLRGYANFLGVDEGGLLRLYEKEKGIRNNLEKIAYSKKEKKEKINISPFLITPKIIIIFIFGMIFFGGFFYLYKEINSFASTPKLVIINPVQNFTEENGSVIVEGVTDKDAKVFINNQPILVSDDGKFHENVVLQFGTNNIHVKAVNRFDKLSSEELIVKSNYQKKELGNSEIDEEDIIAEQNKITVDLRVDPGPVWVSVEVDGNLVFSGTMLTGSVQSFLAKEKIIVSSGKGNATYVKFQDKEIGLLGDTDAPVRGIIFDKNTKY